MVIVDTRRLDDGYPAVDYFERSGLPFIVAVNLFDGRLDHQLDDVRWALAIGPETPVVMFDARRRGSVRDALVTLLRHALDSLEPEDAPPPRAPAPPPVVARASVPIPRPTVVFPDQPAPSGYRPGPPLQWPPSAPNR
jgi:hypothetical protein